LLKAGRAGSGKSVLLNNKQGITNRAMYFLVGTHRARAQLALLATKIL